MSKIENIKSYAGQQLDNIFFRPMLTGESAEELGIKVMYNMPVPTTLHFWKRDGDILRKHTSSGWSGGAPAKKYQKVIDLQKVKAEMAYSAEDYFSTVYELITGRADVNLDDLSGTELEEAETALFRASIAESIRATMWYGNESRRDNKLCTFEGFLHHMMDDCNDDSIRHFAYRAGGDSPWGEKVLQQLWENSSEELKALRSDGNLVFFVTTDVYNAYENELDNVAIESAYLAKQSGREALYYRGIPVVDVKLNGYKDMVNDLPHSFAMLTDRRNLALAVNTNDFPGTEVRMWYNPDMMENRQRALFMAGCDYLLPELVTLATGVNIEQLEATFEDGVFSLSGTFGSDEGWLTEVAITTYDDGGEVDMDSELASVDGKHFLFTASVASIQRYEILFTSESGSVFIIRDLCL